MKKLLLSISLICAAGFVNAQIYSASDSLDFAAWTTYDNDGDTYSWRPSNLTGAGTAFDAQGAGLLSSSWTNATGPLTPDNLVISPVVNCTGVSSVYLNWGVGSREDVAGGSYFEEHYAVYVVSSLASLLAGTYPTPVFETTLAQGNTWLPESVNISAIAANQGSVYVIFRHFDCTDMNFIFMDDISVTNGMPVGVEEISNIASVYPNPTNSILNVKTSTEATSVSIISMDGKVVATSAINGLTGSVNVAELVNGVYFYEVAAADGSVVRNTFVKN
jgi:hypothetical protein